MGVGGFSEIWNHFWVNPLTPGDDSVVVIFFFFKVQASVTYCTHSIKVTSD